MCEPLSTPKIVYLDSKQFNLTPSVRIWKIDLFTHVYSVIILNLVFVI